MKREIAVVVEVAGSRRDTVVTLGDADVTVGDLLGSLGRDGHVTVDGKSVDRLQRLLEVGLRRGSVVVIDAEHIPQAHGGTAGGDAQRAPGEPCSAGGTDPWVRGPRRKYPVRLSPPTPPAPPAQPEPVVRPGLASLLVPIALAALTAVLWNPVFAVFALVAPVVSVATWLDSARRRRVQCRTNALIHARDRLRHLAVMRMHRHRERHAGEVANPPAAEVAHWPDRRDHRLWERRRSHADFMQLRLGCRPGGAVTTVRFEPGLVVGLVGPAAARNDLARALLVQAAAHHGPADCVLGLVADPTPWQWMKWLPHVTTARGDLCVATEIGDRRLDGAGIILCDEPPDPIALGAVLGSSAIVVLADRAEILPGMARLVVDVGRGVVWMPGSGREVEMAPDALDEASAGRFARTMARHHDPERTAGAGLPTRVRLVELLEGVEPEDISTRWKRSAADASWSAPIGVCPNGAVAVDLRRDGPHALVGGTTGSGKSELLRTLVVSLAASLDPGRCNFVLIDYKGGSAFDACARLPHTVGLVTDLDEGLAERALVCLEAELRRRETILRDTGVSTLGELSQLPEAPDLPRLVVVVDEFAAMAAELPDFIDRLVDVAQRGRSLGIHLVLATQRPAGVVGESIRANTDLRIALRVQSAADARDVVDDASAADIPRSRPGRAMMRLAAGHTSVQTAYTGGSARADRITCEPFELRATPGDREVTPEGPSDLERLVDSIDRAAIAAGVEAGPSPWPEPLPTEVYRHEVPSTSYPVFGLIDDPARQRQIPLEWSPEEGNLLMFGLPGSGTTTTLATLVLALSDVVEPPAIYVVAGEDRQLDALEDLGNVGAVIGIAEDERLLRLLQMLDQWSAADRPVPAVLVVDGLDLLLDTLDEIDPAGNSASIVATLLTSGSGSGVSVVATARRPSGVPHRLLATCPRRLVFALADRYDYRALGCARPLVDPGPGRAIDVVAGCEVQVALPHPHGLGHAVESVRNHRSPRRAPRVETLPTRVTWARGRAGAEVSGDEWRLPLGIDDRSREAALLTLEPGVRALIAGPARSGKSTALLTLGMTARAGGLEVVALARPPSPLHHATSGIVTDDVDVAVAAVESTSTGVLVLIDDAGTVDAERLVESAAADPMRIRMIAAGQPNRLRSRYGSWTASFGPDGVGLLLDVRARDGELLGVRLPVKAGSRRVAGRGWLVDRGRTSLVQVALPPT